MVQNQHFFVIEGLLGYLEKHSEVVSVGWLLRVELHDIRNWA